MITIKVGSHPNQESFVIHKERLIFHAPWFASELNDEVKIEDVKEFVVENTEPEIFRLFERWIYFQNLYLKADQSGLVRLHLLARNFRGSGAPERHHEPNHSFGNID